MDKEYFASINEVSRELGQPAYTLRYWEKQFPTVVRPVAGAGGRRYYRPETVARLKTIQDWLYNRGMTIAGLKKMIHSGEFETMPPTHTGRDAQKSATMSDTEYDMPTENVSRASSCFDATKVDLTIGLLEQARELLK